MTALEELQAALQDARIEAATLRIENTLLGERVRAEALEEAARLVEETGFWDLSRVGIAERIRALASQPEDRPAELAGGITAVHDDLPLGHAFKAAPFYPDVCDVKFEEDGRRRVCARTQREHQRSET